MTSKTSITYGGALYDLAKDEGLSAQILADLGAFAAVFRESPDYRRLLAAPSIPEAGRAAGRGGGRGAARRGVEGCAASVYAELRQAALRQRHSLAASGL